VAEVIGEGEGKGGGEGIKGKDKGINY